MQNTYNIYKIQFNKIDALKEKLKAVGLEEHKTIISKNYSLVFYFSNNKDGNKIWWWETYKNFFNDGTLEPKNIFHYGALVCYNNESPQNIYAVSLGKSHFYLSKFIVPDFGINLAVRMADENTILLKKSRYFSGIKRQDVSSYENFRTNSYEPGESVDHLKLKAKEKAIWGQRNIIFADSIQMDMDKNPNELCDIFDQIDLHLAKKEIIQLPKLELVSDAIQHDLDDALLQTLKDTHGKILVEEFSVYGVAICFNFHDYNYRLSAKIKGEATAYKNIGNTFEISSIKGFLEKNPKIADVNSIRVQFNNEENSSFTKSLKELLDAPMDHNKQHYFLKNGNWFRFNQTFMEYLKKSIDEIIFEKKDNLDEKDFLRWKSAKEKAIAAGLTVDDKIVYRESYFNKKQCADNGYLLLDRQLTKIHSISKKRSPYKVEVADLYKDGEIISVKISEGNHELIYNIEQSKDAIELIMRKTISFDSIIHTASLWFVFEDEVSKLTDVGSIQFLLAVESWQRLVKSFNLLPKIYVSRHML